MHSHDVTRADVSGDKLSHTIHSTEQLYDCRSKNGRRFDDRTRKQTIDVLNVQKLIINVNERVYYENITNVSKR